jgi:hypothetical protein
MPVYNPSTLGAAQPRYINPKKIPSVELAARYRQKLEAIEQALGKAERAAPLLLDIARQIVPRLPRRVLASRNLRAVGAIPTSAPIFMEEAVNMPWIDLNGHDILNALKFDIDHDEAPELVDELDRRFGLPRPILVLDPYSGRAHAIYLLRTPVMTNNGARFGPQILADVASRLLAAALRATRMPQVSLVKNPLGLRAALDGERLLQNVHPTVRNSWEREHASSEHALRQMPLNLVRHAHEDSDSPLMWATLRGQGHIFELWEIVAALADEYGDVASRAARRRSRNRGHPSEVGRNCALFDLVRWWAYDRNEKDLSAVFHEAERVNRSFREPLPWSEVSATARSITRFMNCRFQPRAQGAVRRGRDRNTGANLSMVDRQALAGRVSAAARWATTEAKIAAAVAALQASGCRLTQNAIATESGVGINTVARHQQRSHNTPFAAPSGKALSDTVTETASSTIRVGIAETSLQPRYVEHHRDFLPDVGQDPSAEELATQTARRATKVSLRSSSFAPRTTESLVRPL